jgi:acyl-coenzyme A thioesterase 13
MNEKVQPRLDRMKEFIGKKSFDSPSPFSHWLKPIIMEAEYGSLKCEFIVRKDMTNPMGMLHGGVSAGIIDDIIGATIFSMDLSHSFTTINNYIDYFSPAMEGDTIEAHSSVVKLGRQIINLQCEIWLPHKKRLIAKGYSNMIRIEKH